MNDYAKGAVEALAWIQSLTSELEREQDRWERLGREVDKAQNELMSGIAVDFRKRLSLGI